MDATTTQFSRLYGAGWPRFLFLLLVLLSLSTHLLAQSGAVTVTQSFSYTGQIVTWTVPTGVTSLTIEARGAEGIANRNSGRGAILRGVVAVSPTQTLSVLVGGQPTGNGGLGGGGGSFVVTTLNNTLQPLIIAGGGGGGGNLNTDSPAKHGQVEQAGSAATNAGGAGGNAGNGGRAGTGQYAAAGGGGLLSDGQSNSVYPGGKAFVNGGQGGGQGQLSFNGGFGGGGAGLVLFGTNGISVAGGGGGGYSGGGGASANGDGSGGGYGGGGGSYNLDPNGIALTGATAGNAGNGLVTISYSPPQPIRYVKQGGTGDGSSWADASGDLQAMIDASGVEQVWVAGGRYTRTSGGASFVMKNGVAIYGGFVGSEQTLSSRPSVSPVEGRSSSTTLTSNGSGSVISNAALNNTAVLDGMVVTGGSESNGGGIRNNNSSPVITNCVISYNSGTNGGGINNDLSSSPVITNCAISHNSGVRGGGILNGNGSMPRVVNCLINNNSSRQGGGLYNYNSSSPNLQGCTLTGNSAGEVGAGIYSVNDNDRTSLTNCILFNNQDAGSNSIFASGRINSVMANYCLIGQGVTGFTGNNNLVATSSPFASATSYQLNQCSIAVNAGDPTSTPATSGSTDLAGNPRFFQNGRIDIGAFEFQGEANQPVTITRQPASGSSVCNGSSLSVSVVASGTGLTYQWYKDDTPLTGNTSATSATLTLTNVQMSDAGSYSVVVSGTCPGSVTSTGFSLTVTTPATPTLLTQTGHSYPGGQSSVTVDVNSGNVNLVVGGYNGTINWTGPNNTSGTSSPIVVSTERVGQFVYTATCTSAQGCTSPATSATVTVQGRLTVLHRDVDNYADNNAIQPLLVLQNQGSSALPLSRLTLRYYVTVENGGTLGNLNVNYAQVGGQNVRLRYVPLSPAQPGASGYVEVSFTAGAGNLAAGANSGPIQAYFAKSDYGALFEPDDYSYNPVRDQLTATQRITAYYDGVLIAGIEPGSSAQVRSVRALTESRNGASATQINTVLEVRNEGTVAINYSDLRVRYYFTADGNERLQVEVDEGNVSARLVKLPAAVNGADYYLEISYNQGGQLAPGASTGAVRYRISKPDGGRFNQANDYSYQEQPQDRSQNSRVVVLAGNQIVWGTPPTGAPARLAFAEAGSVLAVTVLGNPIQNDQVSVEVTGAEGQPLQFQLLTPQGRVVSQQQVPSAEATQRNEFSVAGQASGLFLLQVSTPTQSQTVKVIKAQ